MLGDNLIENMMNNILEIILLGSFATLFMDLSAKLLSRLKIIQPVIESRIVGRWVLYMLKGKFIHKDITKTPELEYENKAAILAHYLIGIVLAFIYLVFKELLPAAQIQFVTPIIFGLLTTLLPWLWLYPSIGLGFLAFKTERTSTYLITSTVNHFNFGLGFAIWFELNKIF